jgi:hypothetical protein
MKLFLVAAIALVLPYISIAQARVGVGHKLIDASSGLPFVVWGTQELTIEEYDALVLDSGWLRNQPRESVGQGSQFLRSPLALGFSLRQ